MLQKYQNILTNNWTIVTKIKFSLFKLITFKKKKFYLKFIVERLLDEDIPLKQNQSLYQFVYWTSLLLDHMFLSILMLRTTLRLAFFARIKYNNNPI